MTLSYNTKELLQNKINDIDKKTFYKFKEIIFNKTNDLKYKHIFQDAVKLQMKKNKLLKLSGGDLTISTQDETKLFSGTLELLFKLVKHYQDQEVKDLDGIIECLDNGKCD